MPPRADADRNLLFGVLAVQMDFVTRDQLFDAMQAWVFDKSRSLGRIMLDRSALDPETHGLLESLVAKHITRHGGDPRQSLAAVDAFKRLLPVAAGPTKTGDRYRNPWLSG